VKILVLGSGSIGSIFGGFLAQSGHEVTFVGRNPHIETINRQGLEITGIWGHHKILNIQAFTSPPQNSKSAYDIILISVKSYDTNEAVQAILHLVEDNTLIISLQNGLNNYETITKFIEEKKVLLGRVIFGVEIPRPGLVHVTVYAKEVQIGHPENKVPFEKVSYIASFFTQAKIPTQPTREIMKYIWDKVLYNCALNPMSALLDCTYGELLQNPFTKKIMEDIIQEIYRVIQKKNIQLFQNNAESYVDELFQKLIPPTAQHRSSMLQDLIKGRKTEIDSLNGSVLKIARELSLKLPINATLTSLIKAKENFKRAILQ
jgi:2-dehydropantoate 2-reductase